MWVSSNTLSSEGSALLWGANVITVVVPPQMAERVPMGCINLSGFWLWLGYITCFVIICGATFTEERRLVKMDMCVNSAGLEVNN